MFTVLLHFMCHNSVYQQVTQSVRVPGGSYVAKAALLPGKSG